MSGRSFSRVPVNPRLEFGVQLEKVCEKCVLHPGLRELFFKAYLSASGEDRAGEEQFKGLSKIPYVLEALKSGPKGQGRLADRISLKLKLESGKWIIATQTPAGAPLWLLRHFLGCLPRPLLHGLHWRKIAIACCRAKGYHDEGKVLEKIVAALGALPKENYLILVALILLIRNLSAVTPNHKSHSMTLYEEAVEALSQYFIAAIISRPYRPGLYTMLDREHKPLLEFLSEHWLEVKELCRHTGISRYHSTCELRYEFVSPDAEVDRTMWQAMATAQDIDVEIDDLQESIASKSDNQKLPQITKINGTQTFECEFCEDGLVTEAEKLYEGTNEVRVSPARVETLKNGNAEEIPVEKILAVVNIGPLSVFKFCETPVERTDGPAKSTGLLIRNLTSDEEAVYFPARRVTRSDSIDLSEGKVIDEVEQLTRLEEDAVTSKADKDAKTSTNPFKYANKRRDQKRNSNYNDFVTELKDNFKQGRRKPSDAKLQSSHIVLANGQEVTTTEGKGSSKALSVVEFSREMANDDLSVLAESHSSRQELFAKTPRAAISSANSI